MAYYENKFRRDINCHDKIEFEVVFTCFDFSLKDRLEELEDFGFTQEERSAIYDSLKKLTVNVISTYREFLKRDLSCLDKLERARNQISVQKSTEIVKIAESISALLSSIKKYGTPQFSRQARCAFMAKSLCLSLVQKSYISHDDYDSFMSSISTVAIEFGKDFHSYQSGTMSRENFIVKYGHLRAGTYDIQSPRYDKMDIFSQFKEKASDEGKSDLRTKEFEIPTAAINKALSEYDIAGIDVEQLLFFMKSSIEQREYFKFIFTKSLSDAIELIRKIGNNVKIEAHDMGFLDIQEIESAVMYDSVSSLKDIWSILISKRKDDYARNSDIILPPVIADLSGFYYTDYKDARPNFVTEKIMTGDIVILKDENDGIKGKIVVLEKADPGYDWIFASGIAGLITKYGGAASHMAIRCAEFEIPAAIGCGENIFNYVLNKKTVKLDCMNGRIEAL